MRSKFLTQARTVAMTLVAAAALAACGGGGDDPAPAKVTKDIGAITVVATDPVAIAAVKSVASSLVGKSLSFGDVTFDSTTAAVNPALPANTTMTFTAAPTVGVPAGVTPLSGFKIENDLYIVEGYIVAGSAVYVPLTRTLKVSQNDPALLNSGFVVGESYRIDTFSIDFNTDAVPAGTAVDIPVTVKIGNQTVTVNVPAVVDADGKLTVNGQDITTLETLVVTGAA